MMTRTDRLIVQLQGEKDKCGIIRDTLEARSTSEEFEFSCVDPVVSGDIVIGASKRKNIMKPLDAVEAWRIELKDDTFNPTTHKIRCVDENPLDSDDRGDLAEQARKRAAQQKPISFTTAPDTTTLRVADLSAKILTLSGALLDTSNFAHSSCRWSFPAGVRLSRRSRAESDIVDSA